MRDIFCRFIAFFNYHLKSNEIQFNVTFWLYKFPLKISPRVLAHSVHCTFTSAYSCMYLNRKSAAIIERERGRERQKARRKDEMTHEVSYRNERRRERGKGATRQKKVEVTDIDNRFSRDRPTGFTCPGRRVNDDASFRSRTFIRYADRLIYRSSHVRTCGFSPSLSLFFLSDRPLGPQSREYQQPR